MEVIGGAIENAAKYLMTMRVSDFIDIIIVAYLLYKSIWFVRRTNSYNLAKGIVLIIVALWLSEILGLTMINYLLQRAVELGLIALLILFQPELRNLLARMGRSFSNGRGAGGTVLDEAIAQTVSACADMSETRTGALIIFERNVNVITILKSRGTVINGDVTAELLKNLFFNKAPLHDGAVIIRGCRIAEAGCVLPLTERSNLSADLGTRHRAGIGLSENSDAVVVIVSEETGAISVAMDGKLKRHLSRDALEEILHKELVLPEDKSDKHGITGIFRKVFKFKDTEEDKRNEETL